MARSSSPPRTQVLSLPIAVIFSGLSMAVLLALTQSRFGLATLGALGRAAPSSFGLTFKPTFNELCAAVSPHPILGVVVLVGFLYWCLAWAPVTIGAITRGLLAWSLDRLAPRFSEVHPRLHTPVFALLFCGLLGEVSLFLFSFIPTFGLLVGMFGVFLTFIIASVAGMLLPLPTSDPIRDLASSMADMGSATGDCTGGTERAISRCRRDLHSAGPGVGCESVTKV